eukprot:gnl/TRDRNA2_/TRDRNA2_177904_c0_seq5.p2 gnl/TRDRNA2_/TRDRNA2_177904_c0~~gnl/TRDRNA2_/TRDRNA2_177904_c0_seq5.p2  ORF type:complete len:394 (+),score=77.12 gnl/TRDRNA2_/TRDRNA2_177904_c0_seq5:68-1249(+)
MADIKILTTHVGSLPRPSELLPYIRGETEPPADFGEQLTAATVSVFARQLEAGIDIVNDGELGRRDYVTAARKRMGGFEAEKSAVGASDLEEMKEYSDKFAGRKGLLTLTKKTEVKNAACSGPITFTDKGLDDLNVEIDRVVASAKAKGIPLKNVFFSSPSPGTLANFFDDDYFNDHTKYVEALGKAMKSEYDAIYAAGLTLQVDCPDLAMGRHTKFKDASLDGFREAAKMHVRVMNEALADIPAENIRMHVCWGNYPGPHHHDVPLADIIDVVLEAKPKFLSVEACNPGHGHEWEVFETVKWPQDKVIMPGVLDTTTSHIEHPRLIAQRLMNYVRLVGPNNVIACTDCGFSTAAGAMNVPTDIVYAKLASMVKGAQIAEQMAKANSCRTANA